MTTDIPEGSSETFSLGIDLGSTTVKYVLLSPDGSVLAHAYQRHASAVTPTLISLLQDLVRAYPHLSTRVRLTGSGALSLSERLGIGFVQEVIAAAQYLQNAAAEDTEGHPVDAAIELGGEDAKILYLTGSQELRMNEACAGGTGAFLDQMPLWGCLWTSSTAWLAKPPPLTRLLPAAACLQKLTWSVS